MNNATQELTLDRLDQVTVAVGLKVANLGGGSHRDSRRTQTREDICRPKKTTMFGRPC